MLHFEGHLLVLQLMYMYNTGIDIDMDIGPDDTATVTAGDDAEWGSERGAGGRAGEGQEGKREGW